MTPSSPTSILFRPGDPRPRADTGVVPAFAADLHLDELAAAMASGRENTDLAGLFYARLTDPDAVAFRQEVFLDLEEPGLRDEVDRFADRMRAVRGHLAQASGLVVPLERQRWHLEAADVYRGAVRALGAGLDRASPGSRALRAFRATLAGYLESAAFADLDADTDRVVAELAALRYGLRIGENEVTVTRHDDAPDYGAEVRETFARFRRSEAQPVAADVFATADMSQLEAGILERVARLYPAAFRALETHARGHGPFLDPAIAAFADEIEFYLAYLALIAPLRDAGLALRCPDVSSAARGLRARGLFDLALARRRAAAGRPVVTNDVDLSSEERILVVTGPNQGGKTTFARALGQLHHLAALGCPVPASEARVFLVDAVHTQFERTEDAADLAGRLEADVGRTRETLDAMTGDSLVIMNDTFATTTIDDALALNRRVLEEVARRGASCVVVTFLGELASFDETTVSVVFRVDPLDPTRPTFRLERGAAGGLAEARALAELHGLGYAAVRERLTR